MTRELDMPGGKIGAHSWIQVMEGLHTFTVGGHEQDGMLQVRIWEGQTPPRTAQSKDSVVGFKNISVALLPPPAGMTQKQWNERIKTAAREIQEKNGKVKYKLTGGDGGVTTGNCHVITAMVLERAAGKPYVEKLGGYNPKGLNPGWTYIIQPSSNGVSSTQIRFPKL